MSAPPTTPMVRVEGLTVRFARQVALDAVDFTVDRGASLALWGANGAGKTTALRAVLGLVPSTGRVVVDGHDLRAEPRLVRAAAGYVPQSIAFDDRTRTDAAVRYMAGLRGVSRDMADAELARVGLAAHAAKRVGALSGGMRQRLALAVALLGDPPLLILDEPSANLDRGLRDDFLALLATLRGAGKTLLLTSHREEEVAALSDAVLELSGGRAVGVSPAWDWLRAQRHSGVLRLTLPPEAVEEALGALRRYGYDARRNGHGLLVAVSEGHRAVPAGILLRAGITAVDEGFEETA